MPVTKWEIVIMGEALPAIIPPKINILASKAVGICFEGQKKNNSQGYSQDEF